MRSEFYALESFLAGRSSLNSIELDLLGDVKGLSILHLQCHFGQDSISLSRSGAEVVGVDLSDKAIDEARKLAERVGTDTTFIRSDLYDLPDVLDRKFDIVFTSYGTISWLPDLDEWASVIKGFLAPHGRFVFVEFHPVVWMFDDAMEKVTYPYHNAGPIEGVETGSYADRDGTGEFRSVCWNHGIGEVVTSLLAQGIRIVSLKEYDHSPYPFVQGSVEFSPGMYRVGHHGNKLPLVYSIEGEADEGSS